MDRRRGQGEGMTVQDEGTRGQEEGTGEGMTVQEEGTGGVSEISH